MRSLVRNRDYYAFGSPLNGRSFVKSVDDKYRYGFNGKEKVDEINGGGNAYDFGARIYDSRLGRWLSLDPMASKFPMMSPYVAMGNNPILNVDVDGKVFVVYITLEEKDEKTGSIKKVDYKVVFDGTNTTMQEVNSHLIIVGDKKKFKSDGKEGSIFVENMVTSYNYIVDAGADIHDAMKQIATSDKEIIVEPTEVESSYLDGVILVTFSGGMEINTKNKNGVEEKGMQSPALGFWSEVYHAYIDNIDLSKKEILKELSPGSNWSEEKYVHGYVEQEVIDALKENNPKNNEKKRNKHSEGGDVVKTKGPTSTEKAE